MFLKSLSVRGFKSFADRTTFEFEPGVSVIVGPNGSGKSNVVDALSWVLGTRSAKLLRGGELADVIFAGSPVRPAATRAEVEITIDNSTGRLGSAGLGIGGSAQGFSEVRISRTIHASGESVYAINGAECRLLDIQELLSDTGLGRELHTIVGQGQLDAILHGRPEERRAFVEEAAGILKHRRRRERAQRKLEHVDEHVEKLRSVLRELRRQLKPLERQAEAANEHARLQADLREVRVRIAAHDLSQLSSAVSELDAGDEQTGHRQRDLEAAVEGSSAAVSQLEGSLASGAPEIERAREATEELRRLEERLRGTAELVEARRRHLLDDVDEPLAGRPPEELRAQAARLDEQREQRLLAREAARRSLEEAAGATADTLAARREHERQAAETARRQADLRERQARHFGEVDARRGALDRAESERRRTEEQLGALEDRIRQLRAETEKTQEQIRGLDAAEWQLTERLEAAEAGVHAAETELEETQQRQRGLERARAEQLARAEALRAAAHDRGDGVAVLLDDETSGVIGLLADHLRVEPGGRAAVAAALGALGDALVATGRQDAARAIARLRNEGSGRASVLPIGHATVAVTDTEVPGARPLITLITPRDHERSADVLDTLREVLSTTFVAETWDEAVALSGAHPRCTFVTGEGDVAGPTTWTGGSAPEGSHVARSAAADEAEREADRLSQELAGLAEALEGARGRLEERRAELDVATAAINASDAAITGAAEELARLNKELDGLVHQRDVLQAQHADLVVVAASHREALEQLAERAPGPVETDTATDDRRIYELEHGLDEALETARRHEMEVRVTVERLEEQIRHLEEAAGALRSEADEVQSALADAARRRELRREHVRRCGELIAVCSTALDAVAASIDDATAHRDRLQTRRGELEERLATERGRLRELEAQLTDLREQRHEVDLRRAEVRLAMDQIRDRSRELFGLSLDDLAAEHPGAEGFARDELVGAEDTLVRKLGLLGRINPLALEEFEALEQRHAFLSRQLDDLRSSRRDLEEVIAAVDDKIREVFLGAFEDVASEFERVFDAVFPGGEGRLVLTDPDDPLETGIEVEARPPGKRVKRLSLLSGGERSLTALALLFAIFRARPSPFYVLDEVEAALDDVNLQRLLAVMGSFKEHSQLLVVTHQKRTMEIADVLYGVTMGRDAVSKVVAERIGQETSASA